MNVQPSPSTPIPRRPSFALARSYCANCARFLRTHFLLRRNYHHASYYNQAPCWPYFSLGLLIIVIYLITVNHRSLCDNNNNNNNDSVDNSQKVVRSLREVLKVPEERQILKDEVKVTARSKTKKPTISSSKAKKLQKIPSTSTSTSTTATISSTDREKSVCSNPKEDVEICAFRRMIAATQADMRLIGPTWQVCARALQRLTGASWYLYGTSLLGYYRHNASMVPWDDFVDIALFPTSSSVKLKNRDFAREFSANLKPYRGYSSFFVEKQAKIKCFGIWANNSRTIPGRGGWAPKWRWPYIEIQIMLTNFSSTTGLMQTVQDPYWPEYWYSGEDILPLQRATFEKRSVYVPKNVPAVLDRNYDVTWCSTRFYSHKTEQVEPAGNYVSRACADLKSFVRFTNLPNDDFEENVNVTCPEGDAAEDQTICHYLPALNASEKATLLETTRICLKVIEQLQGVTYFLYGGTLLGWYRHEKSIIPWDDDVDLALVPLDPATDANASTLLVAQLRGIMGKYPGYRVLLIESQLKLKCFGSLPNNSREVPRLGNFKPPWRWPYVDIQIMKVNFTSTISSNQQKNKNNYKFDGEAKEQATAIIETIEDPSGFSSFWYPANLVFPVERTTFEKLSVLVPHNVKGSLERNYAISTCVAPYYSHRNERIVRSNEYRTIQRPCSELGHMYTFTNIDINNNNNNNNNNDYDITEDNNNGEIADDETNSINKKLLSSNLMEEADDGQI